MKHLNVGDVLQFVVPLPSTKAEQESIAEVLSDADALIQSLEQLLVQSLEQPLAKKRYIKQGAMQELLTGKKRLPGFSGEWEVRRLGDFGSFLKGSGVRKDEALSGNSACIRYGEIYTRHASAEPRPRYPITGIAGCCAPAATGRATPSLRQLIELVPPRPNLRQRLRLSLVAKLGRHTRRHRRISEGPLRREEALSHERNPIIFDSRSLLRRSVAAPPATELRRISCPWI
jgi:hypothetical protein